MPKGYPKSGINKGWIKKGTKFSEEYREKISLGHKGKKPHQFTIETRKKMSESAKKRSINEMGDKMWKGTRKEYLSLHFQIRHTYGQPNKCEECSVVANGRRIQWANMTGLPIVDRSNWKRLCIKCHYKFDHAKL